MPWPKFDEGEASTIWFSGLKLNLHSSSSCTEGLAGLPIDLLEEFLEPLASLLLRLPFSLDCDEDFFFRVNPKSFIVLSSQIRTNTHFALPGDKRHLFSSNVLRHVLSFRQRGCLLELLDLFKPWNTSSRPHSCGISNYHSCDQLSAKSSIRCFQSYCTFNIEVLQIFFFFSSTSFTNFLYTHTSKQE